MARYLSAQHAVHGTCIRRTTAVPLALWHCSRQTEGRRCWRVERLWQSMCKCADSAPLRALRSRSERTCIAVCTHRRERARADSRAVHSARTCAAPSVRACFACANARAKRSEVRASASLRRTTRRRAGAGDGACDSRTGRAASLLRRRVCLFVCAFACLHGFASESADGAPVSSNKHGYFEYSNSDRRVPLPEAACQPNGALAARAVRSTREGT
jgi:hypothetical protein